MAKKILVVDDEQDVIGILEKRLIREGFDVLSTTSGKQALIQARAHLPDLILMDIVLPDMEGSDVVRELHDHPATVGIPVIFLSGIIDEDGGKVQELTVGGRSYEAIGKPFSYEFLKEKIIHLLSLVD